MFTCFACHGFYYNILYCDKWYHAIVHGAYVYAPSGMKKRANIIPPSTQTTKMPCH